MLHRPITTNESEEEIKISQPTKALDHDFTGKFYQTLKELTSMLPKLLQKNIKNREDS